MGVSEASLRSTLKSEMDVASFLGFGQFLYPVLRYFALGGTKGVLLTNII